MWTGIWLAVFASVAIAFIAVAYVRRWEWAGFAGTAGTERGPKTLWDWLQLLVIPLGLAGVAFALNLAQSGREERREDRRAALERSLALDRRREDVLSAYVQQMSDLMLERGLLTSPEGSQSRAIARTLTLSVLSRLDGKRKGTVVRFLFEAGLIKGVRPIVSLSSADLRFVVTPSNYALGRANFNRADMRNADFRGVLFAGTSFVGADLRGAKFVRIDHSVFDEADLSGANFSRAVVNQSTFSSACLNNANFALSRLIKIRLGGATGQNVDFSGATLSDVDLRNTDLFRPNLADARLLAGSRKPRADAILTYGFACR